MSNELEMKGLDDFKQLLYDKAKDTPKEGLKLIRKCGNEGRKYAVKNGKELVKKRTGLYHKSWKTGKAFINNGEYKIYVKNLAPHAHLIEEGHRNIDKAGNEHGFTKGKKVLETSMQEFEPQMTNIVSDWLDDFLDRGW
jgi:hypothetical protein